MALDVKFARGSSAGFRTLVKDPNTLYFLIDTNEIYLGGDRYGFGKDITIQTVGSGDIVTDVSWDSENKVLIFTLSEAGDIDSIVNAISTATSSIIQKITSDRTSAILVDDTNPTQVKLSLNLAEGSDAGNVQLSQTSSGLKAEIDIPDVVDEVNSSSTDDAVPTAKAVWEAVRSATSYPGAMHLIGVSTTTISDGERQIPTISGQSVPISELNAGDVVLYSPTGDSNYLEFVWDGDKWVQLGDEGSYVNKDTKINAGQGLAGGGSLESDITLEHGQTGEGQPTSYVGEHLNSPSTRIDVDEFGHIRSVSFSEFSLGEIYTRLCVAEADIQWLKDHSGGGVDPEQLRELITQIVIEEIERLVVWNVVTGQEGSESDDSSTDPDEP